MIESDSPLFMKERHNSYEESPDMHREGAEHFQNIEPVFAKKKPRLYQSPQSSLNSNNFADQFRDMGARDTFLFEQNRVLHEDMQDGSLVSKNSEGLDLIYWMKPFYFQSFIKSYVILRKKFN